jgi:hypothetical protein
VPAAEVEGDAPSSETPAGADLQDLDPGAMEEIDFDNGTYILYTLSVYTYNHNRG